jgi:uncharacterized protein (DUF2252 family)
MGTVTDDDIEVGRALRYATRRSEHASVSLPPDRDPLGIIEAQNAHRLEDLVPVRIGRMLQSPFAFYRASAAVMAADLSGGPASGIKVVASGDAHISNFGLFASPERALLFDLNDFDEAGIAPWEWDVKRLAASIHVGGRGKGLDEPSCAAATEEAVAAYRESLAALVGLTALERFHFQVDVDALSGLPRRDRKLVDEVARKARTRTSEQVFGKFTVEEADGRRRIVDQPPITRHVDHVTHDQLERLFEIYRRTLREDVALLLSQFTIVDYVLRVVGVGSVGTRCYLLLLEGSSGEPLFLQAKEALTSVLSSHGGMPDVVAGSPEGVVRSNGHRVVAAQRILQAQSDPFLGWMTWGDAGGDGPTVDYHWRQFRDMKGSIDVTRLDADQFRRYGVACARLLARAHGQSPRAARIVGYLGGSGRFDEAVSAWAAGYADVCERDFAALQAAVASGRFPADLGA